MKKLIALFVFICCTGFLSSATIEVTYTGFNAEQQAAFEYGKTLWEPVINASNVPIKINARFQQLPGFVIVTIPNLIRNFSGAPQPNIWYPNALANALTATELNVGEADVDFFIGSNNSWYYGTDGNCPAGQYDFVTEVMKGISYGLGYMSSFYVSQGMGTYGQLNPSVLGLTTSFPWEPMQGAPVLYDTFICNTQGQFLTDISQFTNISTALAAQITGGNLRFEGQNAVQNNLGEQPVLYAGTFNLAQTARLSNNVYSTTENIAGCPTGVQGAAHQKPSPIVIGMLKDMGWTFNLSSLLTPPQELEAEIEDSSIVLNWQCPVDFYNIHGFVIYRNDTVIDTTQELTYTDLNVANGAYSYKVKTLYSMGESDYSQAAEVTGTNDQTNNISYPVQIKNFPNPFRDQTSISIKLEKSTSALLEIFDIKGRLLNCLANNTLNSGTHNITWNGTDKNGKKLPSGVYFTRLKTENSSVTKKILIIK